MRTRSATFRLPGNVTGERILPAPPLIDLADIEATSSSACRVTEVPNFGAATYHLQGELDATTAPQLQVALSGAAREPVVLLDLTDVSLIDAEGLNVLRNVIHRVHEQGGRVAISRPWRVASSILQLVGTEGFVFLALSPAGAIAWLNRPDNHPECDLQMGVAIA
jgi:anti-anti-sigma factor